jgi:hypothetical protein
LERGWVERESEERMEQSWGWREEEREEKR